MTYNWNDYQHAQLVVATFDAERKNIQQERKVRKNPLYPNNAKKRIEHAIFKLRTELQHEYSELNRMLRLKKFSNIDVLLPVQDDIIKDKIKDLLVYRKMYHNHFRKRNFERVKKISSIIK